jgi:hypothetical protein
MIGMGRFPLRGQKTQRFLQEGHGSLIKTLPLGFGFGSKFGLKDVVDAP